MIVRVIVGLIKKTQLNECDSIKLNFPRIKLIQYFPKPHEQFSGDINVKVDLSNYATKTDIKTVSKNQIQLV